MATIFLTAAGNALLPGFGGVIGGALGSVIDNTFLFPQPDVKGPRLDKMPLGSGSEGAEMNFVLATSRVAGNVIWMSKPIEHEHHAGKGGPKQTTYTYTIDIAIAFNDGEIFDIAKLWANGNLLYDRDADINIASDEIAVAKTTIYTWSEQFQMNLPTVYMDLLSPDAGPDLSQLRSGKDAVLAGFSNGANNGTFRVVSSSIDAASGNSTARLRNSLCVVESSGASVTIYQDLPEFSPNKLISITKYTGTSTQTADPLIESYEGNGNVSGERGTAYVVIQGLDLTDFGNVAPQFNALVEQVSGTKPLADAIADILRRSGRPDSDFDVSAVTGDLLGFNVRGPQPVAQQLAPLMLAFDIVAQERGPVLHFFNRVNAPVVEIDPLLLAAHEEGTDTPRPLDIDDAEEPDLPVQVNVNYIDASKDYQQGTQPYRGNRNRASNNPKTVDLGLLVLTPSQAQDVARRVYWTARANRQAVKLALPPSTMTLAENDRITTTAEGVDWILAASKVDRGANYLIEVESVTEEPDVLVFTGSPADPPSFTSTRIYTTPEMETAFIDLAPLRTEDEESPVIYGASSFLDRTQTFQGAGLYVSDNDSSFNLAKDIASEATMGRTTNAPSASGISAAYWDRKSVLNVKLYGGELESRPELDVLNGRNRALWGREVIGFALAVLQSDGSYNVSNILRGLRDTDDAMTGHVAGEPFVLIDGPGVYAKALSYADIGRTRYFRTVALGGIVSQFESVQLKQRCNTLRHFRPGHVAGVRDPSTSDLTISWIRRTRAVWRLLSTVKAPLLDTDEDYEIEVMNDLETTVLRTISVSAATSVVYTVAQQTTDFGGAHAAVHVRVYQVHSISGRSKAATAVI